MKQKPKYSKHTKRKLKRKSNRRTKRKSNRRPNHRTKRRQIRKNMRGGMMAYPALPDFGIVKYFSDIRDGKNELQEAIQKAIEEGRGRGEPAATAPAPAPSPAPAPAPVPAPFKFTSYPSDTVSYLDKFFGDKGVNTEVNADCQETLPSDKYRLKIDKLHIISCHGNLLPSYTIIPKGLTLHLVVKASSALAVGTSNYKEYTREYKEDQLIQEHELKFWPFTSPTRYNKRGLLSHSIHRDRREANAASEEDANRLFSRIVKFRLEDIPQLDDPNDIVKHKDTYYEGNMDDIIHREYLAENAKKPIKLSYVLAKIAEARKRDDSISADWFGGFCRSGDALNIETLIRCAEDDLPPLPSDFFDSDVTFEGVSDDLRHQSSLASKSETANFMNTVNELVAYSKIDGVQFPREGGGLAKLQTIAGKLNSEAPTLDPDEVCFIFQMKQYIRQNL